MKSNYSLEEVKAIFDQHPRCAFTVQQIAFFLNGEGQLTNRQIYGSVGSLLRELGPKSNKDKSSYLISVGFGNEPHSRCFAKRSTYPNSHNKKN